MREGRSTAIASYRVDAAPGCRGFAQNISDGVTNPVTPLVNGMKMVPMDRENLHDLIQAIRHCDNFVGCAKIKPNIIQIALFRGNYNERKSQQA